MIFGNGIHVGCIGSFDGVSIDTLGGWDSPAVVDAFD